MGILEFIDTDSQYKYFLCDKSIKQVKDPNRLT